MIKPLTKTGGNELAELTIYRPLNHVVELNLRNNKLRSLDLSNLPKLRSLALDNNAVSVIDSAPQLHYLSWRSQSTVSNSPDYSQLQDIHTLHLSSNFFPQFSPSQPFLNLQHLEVSSAGISDLCADFGLLCPNLRNLNMNFNALHDLRPLLGIEKLERLNLAGNRLDRMRRTVAVLELLNKRGNLIEVDLRANPLTLGFYAPQIQDSESTRQMQMVFARERGGHKFNGHEEEVDPVLQGGEKYYLPPVDAIEDARVRETLDEGTKIRRRVYEMMLGQACKRLRRVDGLEIDWSEVVKKDELWDRLCELGVLTLNDRTTK